MNRTLIVEADFVTHRIDKGVPLKDLDIGSFSSKILPLQLIQLLNFLIITQDNEFRILKCRSPQFSSEEVYPMDMLPWTMKKLQEEGW